MKVYSNVLILTIAASPLLVPAPSLVQAEASYGVDVSFPIHNIDLKVSKNYPSLPHNIDPDSNPTPDEFNDVPIQPLGDRQAFYDNFLNGCIAAYGGMEMRGQACVVSEKDRVAMSLRQPQSMQNYTDTGIKKIKAPKELFDMLKDFWEKNKDKQTEEEWPVGNTYTNPWESRTYMVAVDDWALRGGGGKLKDKIWEAARSTIEEWTGQELTQCSLYGIRVYTEGSILATHVDRLPLVSSAIINVAQDVDEPWVLEVYPHGNDGKAQNITSKSMFVIEM